MDSEPYLDYIEVAPEEMSRRAAEFHAIMKRRRTVRSFSSRAVAQGVIEHCLLAAGSAPSGANQQPWHFAVVREAALKRRIRQAAEVEERAFYQGRAPQEWLQALAPLGTNEDKPFLQEAPLLIAIFARSFDLDERGEKKKNYYVPESVGIATGMLITALHYCGLCCLTHTPSPMGFLRELLNRPKHDRPFLLLVVGYPADGVQVPVLGKKSLAEIASFW